MCVRVCVSACAYVYGVHVIILLQVRVQFHCGSPVGENQVRIWAGGCLVHTTLMASDDISFILQAQSCSLRDKSSSFSLKPFYHTTHIEGLHKKMISIVFSHAPRVMGINYSPTTIYLSPVTLSLEWKEDVSVCFFNIDFFSNIRFSLEKPRHLPASVFLGFLSYSTYCSNTTPKRLGRSVKRIK